MKSRPAVPHTVLIVDDSRTVREAVRWALDDAPDFTVAGEAENAAEALERAASLQPEVVLLDIELNGMNGYEVCRTLKSRGSGPAVVFLSVHSDADSQHDGETAGGDGFVSKGVGWPAVLSALRQAVKQATTDAPSRD